MTNFLTRLGLILSGTTALLLINLSVYFILNRSSYETIIPKLLVIVPLAIYMLFETFDFALNEKAARLIEGFLKMLVTIALLVSCCYIFYSQKINLNDAIYTSLIHSVIPIGLFRAFSRSEEASSFLKRALFKIVNSLIALFLVGSTIFYFGQL